MGDDHFLSSESRLSHDLLLEMMARIDVHSRPSETCAFGLGGPGAGLCCFPLTDSPPDAAGRQPLTQPWSLASNPNNQIIDTHECQLANSTW